MYNAYTFVAKSSHSKIHPLGEFTDSAHSATDRPFNIQIFEKCTYPVKKGLAIFPSAAGMSLNKLFLSENN